VEHADPPPTVTVLPSPAGDDGRARIVCCDDSSTMRALLRSLLADRYDLVLTETGEEALAEVRARPPDVILCDLLLPGMSGAALCRTLRADPELGDTPFVLVTTVADADARAEALEGGADDYLYKPIRERELLARVASLVRLRREMRAADERLRALREANVALRAAQDSLVRAERLATVGALAAGLAHEINNPLACVKAGAAELGACLDEVGAAARELFAVAPGHAAACERVVRALAEARGVATDLLGGSRRLERVAADLRVVASPGAAGEELVDPAEAVESAWAGAVRSTPAPPRLVLEIEPGAPIGCARALLVHPLTVVLDNAIHASGPGGTVRIRVTQIPGGVEVAVTDSGPGIRPEHLPRLFDPFFTTRPQSEPAGPGLSVAYGIVHGLGGAIVVDAPPGQGATFRLRLPRRPGAFARGDGTGRPP
jgi:signal transduction histidine kinase